MTYSGHYSGHYSRHRPEHHPVRQAHPSFQYSCQMTGHGLERVLESASAGSTPCSAYAGSSMFYSIHACREGSYSASSLSAKRHCTINLDSSITRIMANTSIEGYISGAGYCEGSTDDYHHQYWKDRQAFSLDVFLNPVRPRTCPVSNIEDIHDYIEQAFEEVTGKALPDDIIIRLCDEKEFSDVLSGNSSFSSKVRGFCLNNKGFGKSFAFIRQDELAEVMLVIGHELGHLMSFPLALHDEEAKAFAFSIEWIKAVKKKNIAGLADSIRIGKPADNGLHNAALNFVFRMVDGGKKAIDVFSGLIKGSFSLSKEIRSRRMMSYV